MSYWVGPGSDIIILRDQLMPTALLFYVFGCFKDLNRVLGTRALLFFNLYVWGFCFKIVITRKKQAVRLH